LELIKKQTNTKSYLKGRKCAVATSTEFQSFINKSLSAINCGNWQNIDFDQFEFNKQQSETITQLITLTDRFEQVLKQNNSLALGRSNVTIKRQGSQDKLWQSYDHISKGQLNVVKVIEAIASGDLSEAVKIKGKEGAINGALAKVINSLRDTVEQADVIAQGNYSAEIQPRSDKDALGKALFLMTQSLREAETVCNAIAQGDLSNKVEIKGKGDLLAVAINQIVDDLGETTRQADVIAQGDYSAEIQPRSNKDILGKALFVMTQSLREAGSVCNAIAQGDLSNKVEIKGKEDQLATAINQIVDNLGETTRQAGVIAQGDYSAEIQPRSNKDILGKALFVMTQSLREAGSVCNAIAEGDLRNKVEIKGKGDQLATAINQIVDNLGETTRQADVIAQGDYSIDFAPRSEKDKLGISLSIMTKNLRNVINKSQREDWIKTGQSELANTMRGEQNIGELTEQVITYLAKYTGAQVGIFYIADEARNMSLASSYAYQRSNNLSNTIAVGEGIVGQAVKEKQTILMSNVPKDYISVNSGLGQASPNNLMVIPILLEGAVKGAIEIGRFGEFDEKAIELISRSNEGIAMAINSAHDRVKMQDLLEEAQRSGEELQAQQEELRASNDFLERQTETISKSEANLKAQQEELQASNEELEEKTEYLQRQKQEILDKNIKIEQSKNKLEAKAKELEISSKYKSEFLANMSHELRTPLNSLLILSELLTQNKEGNLTEKQLKSANIIHRGGHDLLDLINDILDLSKVESGKLTLEIEDIELTQIQSSVCSQFEPLTHNKDFSFTSELASGLPKTIQTDQMRTLQILKNLLSNAFKFTDQGSVIFRVSPPKSEVVFTQRHLNSQNCIGFSVSDTGIGIEQDKQRSIFEAFQQADGSTSRKFGGTGLGLTISRELCRLLGGELQIDSKYQKGSTFTVYLPLLNDGEHGARNENINQLLTMPQEHNSSNSTAIKHDHNINSVTLPAVETSGYVAPLFIEDDRGLINPRNKTVLIIEDDKDFSSVLKGVSKENGYQVLVAGDGKSALHLAAKYQPSAIILDLGLPDLDGLKVLALFKSDLTTRHIPVQIISASENLDHVKSHGAIGVLQKPTSMVELNSVFNLFDQILNGKPKQLMIIDDEEHCRSLTLLLDNDGIEITEVHSGEQAIELMKQVTFDCIVLDLHLPGMSGQQFLQKIHKCSTKKMTPVVINTEASLSEEQYRQLSRYTDKIILKGAVSNDRLLDEVMLLLHQTALALPGSQRQAIQMLHNDESFFDGRTLLLVDDDLRNTFALSIVLEEKGLNVIIAENGLKALEALEQHDTIEVVLMDIMMPVMDGYEAIREIRAQDKYQGLPIIALTAKAMAEDKTKCLEVGANDYMNKPVKMDELLALLKVSIA